MIINTNNKKFLAGVPCKIQRAKGIFILVDARDLPKQSEASNS